MMNWNRLWTGGIWTQLNSTNYGGFNAASYRVYRVKTILHTRKIAKLVSANF